MSIEIKCDRCGSPAVEIQGDSYSGRSAKDSILFTRDGKAKVVDLCEKCRDDLAIFMSGKTPIAKFKSDVVYLELPNPTVTLCDKEFSYLEPYERQIAITGNWRPVEKELLEGGIDPSDVVTLDRVILGVKVK